MQIGALIAPLAQMALGSLVATPGGRPASASIQRLLIGLLGLAAAALLATVALVILAFSAVIWALPPGASSLQICLITATALAVLAVAIWYLTSSGKTPSEIVEETFEPEHSPVENLSRTAKGIFHAFERGWNQPTR